MTEGIINKDSSDYRKSLLNRVEGKASHPLNNGIYMQAHHLISEKGVNLSGMGNLLKMRGYNINAIKNLVFLPCTLPGACHLNVQPHRGDHTYHDDEHPISYHLEVRDRIRRLESSVRTCGSNASESKIQKLLDIESKEILRKIQNFRIPLTSIMKKFKSGNEVGCGNCINVKEHEKDSLACTSQRDHYGEEHPLFKSGKDSQKITKKKPANRYVLKVGR
ncbi:AHH domain-containing protein [Spartinivicinus ruber]|uniref:AHH domain-containing protein n=1 Tax=Spartinivicinus ruber TaxID=2683272 RepID=UPI0013D8DC51|nr:AHH domain-containing protein [Spartinivicinus ruber]